MYFYYLKIFIIVFFSVTLFSSKVFAALSSQCEIKNKQPTQQGSIAKARQYICTVGHVKVRWQVSIPQSCDQGHCGLILDIHGATMTANMQNKGTKLRHYGMIAEQYGAQSPYIVIQPTFTTKHPSSWAGGAYLREMHNVDTFLQKVIQAFEVDTNRIHIYGFSRGAQTVSAYYCDNDKNKLFASFSTHAGTYKCGVKLGKPLLKINGIHDVLGLSGLHQQNQKVIKRLKALGYQDKLVFSDPNWREHLYQYGKKVGQYQHWRLTKAPGYLFESIEHSASVFPVLGHCHPNRASAGWLRCRSTFDIGEKLIKFFIENPKR